MYINTVSLLHLLSRTSSSGKRALWSSYSLGLSAKPIKGRFCHGFNPCNTILQCTQQFIRDKLSFDTGYLYWIQVNGSVNANIVTIGSGGGEAYVYTRSIVLAERRHVVHVVGATTVCMSHSVVEQY